MILSSTRYDLIIQENMSELKRKRKPYSEISDEEKAYRRQWQKENTTSFCVTLNKEFIKEFKQACIDLGISQHSVIKNVMSETIKKAKE